MLEGTLSLKWSKKENDLICHFPNKPDGNLCHSAFNTGSFHPLSKEWSDSFVNELKQRGYDITTLKFSIKKKK